MCATKENKFSDLLDLYVYYNFDICSTKYCSVIFRILRSKYLPVRVINTHMESKLYHIKVLFDDFGYFPKLKLSELPEMSL